MASHLNFFHRRKNRRLVAMQSKAVTIISKYATKLLSEARASLRSGARASSCVASGAGNPKVHSEDPQGEDAEQAARAATAEEEQQREKGSEKTSPSASPKATTFTPSSPSQKLENPGESPLADPIFQQKRSGHTRPNDQNDPIQTVECVGVDGTPAGDEEDDYKEYYREHKASPLSEVEFVDTRVPMRQATDSSSHEYDEYGRNEVILWSPEQLDTAEEALRRAEAMFRAAAERGDPDTPWGRVLAGVRRY